MERFNEWIQQLGRTVRYRKDQEIVVRGSRERCLYYVEEGTVEVSHGQDHTRIVVALIGPGEFFGEIGFFDGVSRVRNIRATNEAVLRIIDWETMESFRRRDPESYAAFITRVAQSVCAKFRRILEEQEPLTAYAASLSTGRRQYHEARPLPEGFFQTREGMLVHETVERVKTQFFDLTYSLQQSNGASGDSENLERCFGILHGLNERLNMLEPILKESPMENYAWGYIFKEIFPYFMRSRFAERAYYKPKGYAGDFLMMEMIYNNRPAGDGKLGPLVDHWCLNSPASKAVRGRRALLASELRRWTERIKNRSHPLRIMNVACGSSRELFDFLKACPYDNQVEALCMDADMEALQYVAQTVNVFPHRAQVSYLNDNVVKWAIGRSRQRIEPQDIIYSAGLTDYLDRRLFVALLKRCHETLKPGGILIIGNFSPRNPNRAFMDHILHWKLIYRSEQELREIFADSPFGNDVSVFAEEHGINLFVKPVKTDAP